MKKMIKLIVADMDGTLLNDNHEIHSDFWEMEKTLDEKGIMFAIASGRQFYNLEEKFEKLKHRMMFFAENGTQVMHKGKELFLNPLDSNAAIDFIKIGRELPDNFIVLCGKTSAYVENDNPDFIKEIKQFYKALKIVDDLTEVDDTFLKVTYCNFQGVEENIFPHLEKFQKDFKVAIAADIFIDITNLTANKGTAIKGIQEKLNISPDETLAFGDYLNDLEMMQNATHSYAMKNAHPEIIEASNYITKFSNNENGVLRTIEELGLLETK